MTTPRIDLSAKINSYCGLFDLLKLDEIIIQWLRGHFGDPNNIEKLQPAFAGQYVWTNSDDTTGILIEDVTKWKPTMTEKRPAVMLKRGDVQVMHQGILADSFQGGDPNHNVHTNLLVGTHTAFCISRQNGEVGLLGSEVYRELMRFAPLIKQRLGGVVAKIAVVQIGGSGTQLQEATENWVIPVSLAYAFWDTWEIVPEDVDKLQSILLTLIPQVTG